MEAKVINIGELRSLAEAGMAAAAISERLGVRASRVYYWAKKLNLKIAPCSLAITEPLGPDAGDPSIQEIAERAAMIRSGWTSVERARRIVGGVRRWSPPEVATGAGFR